MRPSTRASGDPADELPPPPVGDAERDAPDPRTLDPRVDDVVARGAVVGVVRPGGVVFVVGLVVGTSRGRVVDGEGTVVWFGIEDDVVDEGDVVDVVGPVVDVDGPVVEVVDGLVVDVLEDDVLEDDVLEDVLDDDVLGELDEEVELSPGVVGLVVVVHSLPAAPVAMSTVRMAGVAQTSPPATRLARPA